MPAVSITTTCPRCASAVAGDPDPVAGTLTCGACGTRFDPRQRATIAAGSEPVEIWQPRAGERIEGYQLEHELGRGGMSSVWQARQDSLARPVAVKILHAHLAADDELRRRFAREAEAMVQLDHPHIVPVIDRGEHRGRPYLVMGVVGASTLRDELGGERGGRRLAPARIAILAEQVLRALAHAHARGLVHRDIKPDNLLLDERGALRVADFGIAQVARSLEGHTLTQLTGTRVVMGTVAYMAPEQAEATRSVDHRCDLYALGVICYEALRGHRPVGRFEDPAEGLDLAPGAAAAWNRFVLSLLERDPERRPADAASALELLAQTAADPVIEPERVEAAESGFDAATSAAIAAARAACGRAADTIQRHRQQAAATTTAMNPAAAAPPGFPHGRHLLRPREDRWISGACGGLGRWLGVHPDWIRLAVVLAALVVGPGVLAAIAGYVVAVIAIPPCPDPHYRPRPLNHAWPARPDGWFLGVSPLLARLTGIPAGLWRIGILLALPLGSWIPYLALGILLPAEDRRVPAASAAALPRAEPPPAAADDADADADAGPGPGGQGRAFRFWSMLSLSAAAAALLLHANLPPVEPDARLLWWITGAALFAAVLASPNQGGRPRAGGLGGLLAGLGLAELLLLVYHQQGVAVGAPALAGALAAGGLLLLALVARRYAALLLGSAGVIGVGGAALLATLPLPAGVEAADWFLQPIQLLPIAGVVLTATVYAMLAPLLDRDDRAFQLAPTLVGLAALGALGIILSPLLSELPALSRLDPGQPVPLLAIALLAGLVIATGRHVLARILLGLTLAVLFLVG